MAAEKSAAPRTPKPRGGTKDVFAPPGTEAEPLRERFEVDG
ncbi:hypothetical protein ABZ806_13765 [Spirillospora sp. NPDC047418]